jgi:casein kinase 1, epsilon
MDQVDNQSMTLIVEGKYRILSKIGEGSFGKIFSGVNANNDENVAIKIEKSSESSLLKNEAKLYKLLEDCVGIPKLRSFGQEGIFNYMVIDLLGDSLEGLRHKCSGSFSLKTVIGIGLQMIRRLEAVHSIGVIHRDIKPDNFLIDPKTNMVYLIDFGLARSYLDRDNKHFKQDSGRKLTGTVRYASVNVHQGLTPSRRDDLESLGYVILYLLNGKLPWQSIKSNDKEERYRLIGEHKVNKSMWECFDGSPDEFIVYLNYCRRLEFDEDPDYEYLRNILANLYKHQGYTVDKDYDWDSQQTDLKAIYDT